MSRRARDSIWPFSTFVILFRRPCSLASASRPSGIDADGAESGETHQLMQLSQHCCMYDGEHSGTLLLRRIVSIHATSDSDPARRAPESRRNRRCQYGELLHTYSLLHADIATLACAAHAWALWAPGCAVGFVLGNGVARHLSLASAAQTSW
ncbi:hypothetical protein C8Q80DRAFT_939697 [Daedaleopsis nitida]|nr:hypothetical protein C8Q80DRAFT_939697 [Daedaleopsis nitida]